MTDSMVQGWIAEESAIANEGDRERGVVQRLPPKCPSNLDSSPEFRQASSGFSAVSFCSETGTHRSTGWSWTFHTGGL